MLRGYLSLLPKVTLDRARIDKEIMARSKHAVPLTVLLLKKRENRVFFYDSQNLKSTLNSIAVV